MPEPFEIWSLNTIRIGRTVRVFREVESTNTLAGTLSATVAEFADQDLDGLVIVAENQTAGRGRFGRVWQSRAGSSLLMSVVLRPPPELRRPSILTAWAAVGIGNAIHALTGVHARIKWPNDLLIHEKKVCGILIEQGHTTVVGIGLNINQTAQEFTHSELREATSLGVVSGTSYDLRAVAEVVLHCLDVADSQLRMGDVAGLESIWKQRIGFVGRDVCVEQTDTTHVLGRLKDMTFAGLTLQSPDGTTKRIVPEMVAHIWSGK